MYYDKYDGLPPPNSPLESLFILITLRRMEASLLANRAQVHAAMLTPDGKADPVIEAFKDYADKALPFLATAQDADKQNERDTLIAFTKLKAKLNTSTQYNALKNGGQAGQPRRVPKNFKLRPKMPGL